MYFIYKIIVNDKNYIGSTNNIRIRLIQHKYNLTKKDSPKYNLPFYKYIRNNKLTIEECKLEIVKILWDCNSMNNAKIEEQKCIEELKPKNNQKSIVSIINRFRNEKHVSPEDQETLSHALSPDELSIVMGFRFQYATKVKFEYAKYLVKYQKLAVAQNILEELIYTQNLDWRVCYRSYYLLAQVMVAKNQIELAELNIKKCLKAYKHFFPALELAKTISSIKMNTQSI